MTPESDSAQEKGSPSQASRLVEVVEKSGVMLFRSDSGEPCATAPTGETWALPSRDFNLWLRNLLWEDGHAVARDSAVRDAEQSLASRALRSTSRMSVAVRVARTSEGVFVDLGDRDWRCVEVTPKGWRVIAIADAPVRFRRSRAGGALPEPERGGRLDELREHVNLSNDDGQWSLVAGFLVSTFALAPNGPFPILLLHGEQGSMKTSCTEHLSSLIDPRRAGLRAMPRDLATLAVAADNSYLLAFDNVSNVEPAMSDGLCRLATGAGFARRTLYEDRDETVFAGARPLVVNSVGQAFARADLIDRSVAIELAHVPERQRRMKCEVDAAFAAARPRILGSIFDAVSLALREMAATSARLSSLPRMADFTVAAVAAEPAMGVPDGTFLRAYALARRDGAETAADSDPVVLAIRDLVRRRGRWVGSAGELLDALERPPGVTRQDWPDTATKMGNRLTRARTTALPAVGVDAVQLPRTGDKGRRWSMGPCSAEAPAGDTTPATPANERESRNMGAGDASDTFPRPTSPQAHSSPSPAHGRANGATTHLQGFGSAGSRREASDA